jgi:hypothetical protein
MRELIYLSKRKLRQFQDRKPSRGWGRRIREFGATAPMGLGELQVAFSDQTVSDHPDLARVLRHITRSDPPPKWFFEGDPQPGTWVRFQTRLNYKIVEDASFGSPPAGPPALLFWEPKILGDNSRPRLLLHGSPEHLVGGLAADQPPAERVDLPLSEPTGLVEFLVHLTNHQFSQALWYLLRDLDGRLPPEIASTVTGFARVTANLNVAHTPFYYLQPDVSPVSHVIVASPLFVERMAS